MVTRTQLLQELVALTRSPRAIVDELASFTWDSTEELVAIRSEDLCAVLGRYLGGELSSDIVEEWANAVEMRDDLGYDSRVGGVIDELANPVLHRPLSDERARKLISEIVAWQ